MEEYDSYLTFILPRTMRPYRCNWWYCDPLLEAFNRWRPRKQRMFISLMQDITQIRFRMCNQFKEIHTVVSRTASNRSLKPAFRLHFSSQQRNNAPNNELIPLKIPHLLRCIRAESLKLKAERG
jgi:hypothetical protein